jgi:type VI secretion system protein VasG
MVQVSLNSLVEKLSPIAHAALEQAAWLCRSMTHYDIEVEHLLLKLVDEPDADLARILRHYGVDVSRLSADLTGTVERFKRGNTRDTPGISPRIPEVLKAAWLQASVDCGFGCIRSANIIWAVLTDAELSFFGEGLSSELDKIDTEDLGENLVALTAGGKEDDGVAARPAGDAPAAKSAGSPGGKKKALEQFTVDLTAEARAGRVDPVLERDGEIRQMVDILMRRRQNNPILTGEAGVGKTAVVEGLARRIAEGDVPPPLRDVEMRTLDLALLQAGAGVKGEFERRLEQVIDEVKASPKPIVLFIDEAHTMIGAGGAPGQSDAANILKPALARGELRTIAATTWAEYKKFFEKDAALTRRFQVVKVEEPQERQATVMIRGLVDTMESHHRVRILPDAVDAAVKLSSRYLSGRQLPDKAVSVLDTAAARVAVGQSATPPSLEHARRQISNLETEKRVLSREIVSGADHGERMAAIDEALSEWTARSDELQARLENERELVGRILDLRGELDSYADETESVDADAASRARERLAETETELARSHGEDPLVKPFVDGNVIAEVISGWTGIPVGRMVADEVATLLRLEERLEERVVGQDDALRVISRRIRTSRANLDDPKKPIGVFLLLGPSGIGKTETALSLAELLYGGERNVISINMSEFQEAHTVSSLKGSPPGYVGYGEGGVLTEAVRRRPYSVVLLDEVEKAHPDVMELFYQVFDKGTLEDGEGRQVDFANCVIILTSNLGSDTIDKLCADEETRPEFDGLVAAVRQDAIDHFKPALVGRMTVVPYVPLGPDVMRKIIDLKVGKILTRIA